MPGSVWARKDGRWGCEVPYRDAFGRRKTLSTTKTTEDEARAWLEKMQGEIRDEAPVVRGSQTLASYLDEWLRDAVEPRVSARTYDKRSWAVRIHIVPALGSTRLRDLDARSVERLYASMLREGYSYSTRREIHVTLKMALSQALKWELVRRNVCEVADSPRDIRQVAKEGVRHLTDEQARRLFALAYARGSRWRNYYVVAVRTGLRPGEMLALRWGDVDLSEDRDVGTIRVRRTLDYHRMTFNPPKTARSRRTVALHVQAHDALRDQRDMLRGEGLPTTDKALVFPATTGAPMSGDNLRNRELRPDLARAGLPPVSLHELRHTFASIMLHEWLVPPAVVSEAMGHADISFTFRVYGHLIESAQADVMRRLNASQTSADMPVNRPASDR